MQGAFSNAGAGGRAGSVAEDSTALPPGTCIAVQLDARGGHLHDWLARKVTGGGFRLLTPHRLVVSTTWQ